MLLVSRCHSLLFLAIAIAAQGFDPRGRAVAQLDKDVLLSGLRNFFPRKEEDKMQLLRTLIFNEVRCELFVFRVHPLTLRHVLSVVFGFVAFLWLH